MVRLRIEFAREFDDLFAGHVIGPQSNLRPIVKSSKWSTPLIPG
jgi:hypothetical protein